MSTSPQWASPVFVDAVERGQLPSIVVEARFHGIVWANAAAQTLGLLSPIVLQSTEATSEMASEVHGNPQLRGLHQGESWSGKCAISTVSGPKCVQLFATAVGIQGDPLLALQLVDISEDQRLRAQHEAQEKDFQALIASEFDVYWNWDLLTGVIEFSGQIHQLLRLPEDRGPASIDEWASFIHPEDRDRAVGDALEQARLGIFFDVEYRVVRADGTCILVSDRGVPMWGDGDRAERMVGALRDITKEREADRATREAANLYQTLFKGASVIVLHIGADGCFLDASDAALSTLALSHDQLARLQARDYLPNLWQAIDGQEGVRGVDSPLMHEVAVEVDEQTRHLLLSLVPSDVLGATTWFAIGVDITAIKELTLQLELSEERSREQAHALEDRATALRVLMEQRERDRLELRSNVEQNIDLLVMPVLDRLNRSLANRPEIAHIEALRETLNEIVQPVSKQIGMPPRKVTKLTARELEILNLIRTGMTSTQIAECLYISQATVAFHRSNIRKKLGVTEPGRRFSRHFATLAASDQSEEATPGISSDVVSPGSLTAG